MESNCQSLQDPVHKVAGKVRHQHTESAVAIRVVAVYPAVGFLEVIPAAVRGPRQSQANPTRELEARVPVGASADGDALGRHNTPEGMGGPLPQLGPDAVLGAGAGAAVDVCGAANNGAGLGADNGGPRIQGLVRGSRGRGHEAGGEDGAEEERTELHGGGGGGNVLLDEHETTPQNRSLAGALSTEYNSAAILRTE